MFEQNFTLRLATPNDYDAYYEIRSEKKNLFWTGYENAPNYTTFSDWYNSRLKDTSRKLYLLFNKETCVGSLHIDFYDDYSFIGYSVKENNEGRGIATFLVQNAIEISKLNKAIKKTKAWINENNIGSIRVVEKNGFTKSDISEIRTRFGKEDIYFLYELNLLTDK